MAACTPVLAPAPAASTQAPSTPTTLSNGTPGCETHTASVVLSASPENLRVGDTVTVTVKLNNEGCVGLGLPQYRLAAQSDGATSIFEPANPEPVVHSLGVGPGQSDAAEFGLEAVAGGQATVTASVSYEVHIGYPGPAYWAASTGEPLRVIVAP